MSSHKKQLAQYKKRRLRKLKKKMRRPSFVPPEAKIVYNLPGAVKMSQVLQDFVKPYMEADETEESLRKLVTLGVIAWNAALLPPSERDQMLRETGETLSADARDDLRTVLEPMIQRRLEHFADNRRAILGFDLTMEPTGPYLNVMSTLEA